MGCRSSAPLDVIEMDHYRHPLEAFTHADLTLADWTALERRTQFHRSRGRRSLTQEERLADIAALQQSLSVMENFFQSLVGQAQIYMEAMDPNNVTGAGPPPASGAAILSLLQTPLSPSELSPSNKGCSICCEEYLSNEIVTRLPCGHFYHPNCVQPWLEKHCTCPTCRYELPTDDPDFEKGRMERMGDRKLHPSSTQEGDSWTCSLSDESHHLPQASTQEGDSWTCSWSDESHHLPQASTQEGDSWTCTWSDENHSLSALEEAAQGNAAFNSPFREDDDERSASAMRAESERSRVQNGADIPPFASFSVMGEMLDEVDKPSSDYSVSSGPFYVGNENEEYTYQPPTETRRGHHYLSSDSSVSRGPFYVGNENEEYTYQPPTETSTCQHYSSSDTSVSYSSSDTSVSI